jgi:hypothetical protein
MSTTNPEAQGTLGQPDTAPTEGALAVSEILGMDDQADNLGAYLQLVLDARKKENEAKQHLVEKAAEVDEAERILAGKMLEQGTESFRALGKTVTRFEVVHVKVLAADRDRQREWLRENGFGALIQETVNHKTFQGLMQTEFIDAKKELPDFVDTYKEPALRIQTSKGKGTA